MCTSIHICIYMLYMYIYTDVVTYTKLDMYIFTQTYTTCYRKVPDVGTKSGSPCSFLIEGDRIYQKHLLGLPK